MAATLESAIATANPAITPGSKSNALIYGDGDWEDPSNTSFQNISDALVGIGDNTTQMPGTNILPTGFSSYGQIWLDTIDPISTADEWSLEAFVKNGGSLYLNGEWGSTSNFDNQTVQDILNALIASPPSVTGNAVGESAQPVQESVLDGLAVTPNPLTTWTPDENGDLSGVAKKNVLFSDGSGASGAAWQVGSNGGRLVVLMDVNWAQSEYMDSATMPQVAANIGYFLGH